MSTLADRLAEDLKTAMRAGDTVRRDELRGLLAALKGERQTKLTRELDKRGLLVRDESAELTPDQQAQIAQLRAALDLSDDEEQAVLQQRVKQHRQSIEGFSKGGRADLVAAEEAQLAALQAYLPQPLDTAELEDAIRAAIGESGAQ